MAITKKKKSDSTEILITKYLIDTIVKNPMSFIPIIESMLDPRNPDSVKLHDEIAKSISKAIISKTDLKNLCLERILQNIEHCTDQEIFKIVNDQRLSLEKDSKQFIKTIQEKTTIALCEKYFQTQQTKFDEIFDDYFKELSKSIQSHIEALDKKTQEIIVKTSANNCVSVEVPAHMQKKVVEYVKFIQSQEAQ